MTQLINRVSVYPPKTERNSALELLRIIATLFVIIVHYNNAGGGKAFLYTEALPLHYHILLFCEMLAICAVNIFVMISGYFLCISTQVRIWKILWLYIDVIFISVLQYFFLCLLGDTAFSVPGLLGRFIPLNWYVAVYSGLYLISPYINQILQSKNRSQFRFFLLVFFFVLSVWPSGVEFLAKALDFSPNSWSPISNQGSGDGYTLVNFILLYVIGAYCRLHQTGLRSSRKVFIATIVYLGCTVLNTLYAHFFFGRAVSYCNPLVVIQSVALFTAFQNTNIRNKTINTIASCSFGVYLMHGLFFRFFQIEQFVTGNPFMIPVHVIVTAILIYAVSALIYWMYMKQMSPVFALLQRKLHFLTYDVNGFIRKT